MVALGVGMLTAALAVADATLIRPLPFDAAGDAVLLSTTHRGSRGVRTRVRWSFERLQLVRDRATTLDRVTSWTPASLTLTGRHAPDTIAAEVVSRDYFALLGIGPVEGRTFTTDEDRAGVPQPVVVVSERFVSRRRTEGDDVRVGRTLTLNGQSATVVGVLPGSFRGLTDAAELWLPTPMAPVLTYPEYLTTDQEFIALLARIAPGRTIEDARQEVSSLVATYLATSPDAGEGVTISAAVESLGAARVRPEGRRAALLALAGAGLLFLLTAANLVALLAGRVLARHRDTAVAVALGATSGRVWRAHAAEGSLLVAAGCLVALAAFTLAVRAAGPWDPLSAAGRSQFASFSTVTVDGRVLVIWWLTSLVACAIATSLPYWFSRRSVQLDALRTSGWGTTASGLSMRRPGAAAAVLVVEAMLAVVLIATAGQLLESYRRMAQVDVGVDPANVLTFEVQPPESRVATAEAPAFVQRVLESLRDVPGVRSASVDGGAPLAGSASTLMHIVGRADGPSGPPLVLRHYVGPEHFETLGIPIRSGRGFTDADRAGAPRVVIVSESAARRFFPAGDALGQRVWFEGSTLTSPAESGEIIGIVGDVKYDNLIGERTTASFYTPFAQFTYGWRVYFVKVQGEPRAMERAVIDAVGRVAPDVPVRNFRPLEEILTGSRAQPRRAAQGTGALAVVGLVLAVAGIWAIVSHSAARRTKEMAVRIAHGATAGDLVRLVVIDGLLWPGLGLALGSVLAVAASGALRTLLYDVAPGDPAVVGASAALFLTAALGACLLPAWRAARVDPIPALRG